MEEHSIFFYILLFLLGGGALYGGGVGTLFFFKRTGDKRANAFFGMLLLSFSLTLLHNTLYIAGFFEAFPKWKFLPVYFTLTFPPLFFYYVKLNCYPSYRFRWTDLKHAILPLGQLSFFLVLFFMPVSYKSQIDRNFYNPFYGAFEQFLYLTTFFAYLYFAYRYTIERRREVKHRKSRTPYEVKRVIYLEKLLQILFFLFCIHTVFVLVDFVSYEFLQINLRSVKTYAALGALSFAALVYWLSIYGSQVLIWGRRVFKNS